MPYSPLSASRDSRDRSAAIAAIEANARREGDKVRATARTAQLELD
jgi:hypothetical protein